MEIPASEIRHTKTLAFDTCERFRANMGLIKGKRLSPRLKPRRLGLVAKFVIRASEIAHVRRRSAKVSPFRSVFCHSESRRGGKEFLILKKAWHRQLLLHHLLDRG